MITGY